jgi:cytoskeleton protein RodZ
MASFGETMRRERELRGIALEEIAAATKIGTRFLQAIEQDRVDILPGGMFSRAFVRQYASFLGLDVERTVAEFVRLHASSSSEMPASAARRSRQGWGAATLLGAAGLLGVGLLSMGRGPARSRSLGARLPGLGLARGSSVVARDPIQPAGLVLQLRAEQDCWVETQADGQTVMSRVMNAGETATVEAASEVLLAVGNAGGLSVSFNGQPGLPLGRNGEVRRNVRITRENLGSFVKAPVAVAFSRSS